MHILLSKTQIFLKASFFKSHLWHIKMDTVNLVLISLCFSSVAAKMGTLIIHFQRENKDSSRTAMKQLADVIREPKKFPGKEINNSAVSQDFG